MNTKLNRVLDEIKRTEEKIAVWQEHLEELNIRKKQLEDAEIIKSIRSMKLGSREMIAFLEEIQNGRVSLRQGQPDMAADRAENVPDQTETGGEPEKEPGETGNSSRPEEIPAEREDREDEEKD